MADVLDCLERLIRATGVARQIGRRLWSALRAGWVKLSAHGFFCAPLGFAEMPDDLWRQFEESVLTMLKGTSTTGVWSVIGCGIRRRRLHG